MPFEVEDIGKLIIYSFMLVQIISYFAGVIGFPTLKVGYGLLIIAVSVFLAMIASGQKDYKYYLFTVGGLILLFFLLKNYVPDLFSVLPGKFSIN